MSAIKDIMQPICDLPQGYAPSEQEDFMNPLQQEYFRLRLLQWREELLNDAQEALRILQEKQYAEADPTDRASNEADLAFELRTGDRARKLTKKIDAALERLRNGSYGFCEETGEPISLRRLEARPIATMSVEAQERHERQEKTHRDE